MKNLTILWLSFMITSFGIITQICAQSFEGRVAYADKYTSKMGNMNDAQFTTMMGSSREYIIKGGNYKFITNGTLLQWQLYVNKDNKLYTKMGNSLFVLWNDAAESKDEVLKAELNKDAATLLGYSCDELVLTCKTGVQKFYFSNKLPMDGSLFTQHKLANFHDYISRANAVPLKIIIDNAQFTLESVVVSVKKETIADTSFDLPENVKLQKSTY